MVALLHAQRHERSREVVNIVPELRVCPCVVQLGVSESVLVREFLAHSVEDIREGVVDEPFLRPDVLSAVLSHIVLKRVLVVDMVGLHIVCVLRYNNARVGQLVRPALHPFKGDIAAVVDAFQGFEHTLYGHIALAHYLIYRLAVLHHAVLDVGIFDMLAEVGNGRLGGFAAEAVGVVEIPERADLAAAHAFENVTEALCVAVVAVGLHKQGDVVFLSLYRQFLQLGYDEVVVHQSGGSEPVIGEDTDK